MSIYSLEDYNALAYEFAIRNPRVLELIKEPLTDKIVKELSVFGLIAKIVEVNPEDGSKTQVNSLKDLYLEYKHIDQKSLPCNSRNFSPEGIERFIPNDKSHRKIYYPKKSFSKFRRTSINDEIKRIDQLIETRGRKSKLDRLMSGEVFRHYDEITFFDGSIYSLDTTKHTEKTIRSDIAFVKEWIEPSKYLLFLPKNHKYTSRSYLLSGK